MLYGPLGSLGKKLGMNSVGQKGIKIVFYFNNKFSHHKHFFPERDLGFDNNIYFLCRYSIF